MDVLDLGRVAVFQDPSGALLCLWQPKRDPGAGVAFEPNSLVWWAELSTRDTRACREFYPKVLGWKPKDLDMGDLVYTVFNVGEKGAAGTMQMPPELARTRAPSAWGIYFAVADARASIAKARRLGGKALSRLHDAPGVGKLAPLMDPQGGVFHILQPAR